MDEIKYTGFTQTQMLNITRFIRAKRTIENLREECVPNSL